MNVETRQTDLLGNILALEAGAARLEGAFAADPEIGLIWRSQVALSEACRSVGMEGIHVLEGDVIHRTLENRLTDAEGARGTLAARALLRVILAPGDLSDDPAGVLERCWTAGVAVEGDEEAPDFVELGRGVARAMGQGPTPFLGALRATVHMRFATGSAAPSVDRLVFMAAEHTLRSDIGQSDQAAGRAGGLLGRVRAGWTMLPSLALTQSRFRSWSPMSDKGHLDLITGLRGEMDRAIGMLPVMRRWRDGARVHAAGRHGRSRYGDLVELAFQEPILTARHVQDFLGISSRSALYLVQEAAEAGFLVSITPRATYRVWATPYMADLLKRRSMSKAPTHFAAPEVEEQRDTQAAFGDAEPNEDLPADWDLNHGAEEDGDAEERTNKALAELDDAMANVDAVLKKYRS